MKTARHSDSLLLGEARKHLAFREVWVALALTLVYFVLFAKPMSDVETRWLITQHEIYRMGNIGVAFMLITTLPRLVTCEGDYGTRALICASRHGARDTFRAKLGYAAVCCLACVLLAMVFGLGVSAGGYGFKGAFEPVAEAQYYSVRLTPGLTNIGYCLLQYLFFYVGALYFAAFVLLVAALTRRAALTVGLCTLLYVYGVLCNTGVMVTLVGDSWLINAAYVLNLLLPTGFITHESFNALYFDPHLMPYSHRGTGGDLGYVWIALLYAFAVTALIVFALWRVYRRRDRT